MKGPALRGWGDGGGKAGPLERPSEVAHAIDPIFWQAEYERRGCRSSYRDEHYILLAQFSDIFLAQISLVESFVQCDKMSGISLKKPLSKLRTPGSQSSIKETGIER
ncbi:hypothetical protein CH373_12555 [Leptospira perolatii]|uniref:Uncharacterized protein n=1 Tax=Leptospira perolatii TaxID=2023191 RepID=A0A2M9ZLL8_9LEPT|nr:hypothetical protein CH360_06415 [Leptospira perolatii]PJZ72881.1 hypothetical protein CH373_12555 [Leptospira perolatii]